MKLFRCAVIALFVGAFVAIGCSDKKPDGTGTQPKDVKAPQAQPGIADGPAPPSKK